MKKLTKILAAIVLMTMVIMTACTPENNIDEDVQVTTNPPIGITNTSAICSGWVTIAQGPSLTELGICWSTSATPMVEESHIAAESLDCEFYCIVDGLEPNTKYYCCAYAIVGKKCYYGDVMDFTTWIVDGNCNGHDYVDLGLPSGTLWATCNVGADNLWSYGSYYSWGEKSPKNYYNWDTYQFCMGGYGYNTITKYCNDITYGYHGYTDTLTTLLPEDDVAVSYWGGGWRIPTKAQWEELLQYTTNTWTDQYSMEGVNVYGRIFTASNGHSLFLPAVGARWFSTEVQEGGTSSGYWSSSLDTGGAGCAWFLYFNWNNCDIETFYRGIGRPVRAVCSAR